MTGENIFAHISSLLKANEIESRILQNEMTFGKKWNYSICATPITVGKPLIIGINWGGGGSKDGFNYSVQEKMPTKEEFLAEFKSGGYKFLSLSKEYFKKHLDLDISSNDFNYSNLCFFRTPKLKYLKGEDFKVSIPILKQYVKELLPPLILSLGNTNIKYLELSNEIDENSLKSTQVAKVIAYRGTLWSTPFYCLPHPSAHIRKIYRDEIWERVFKTSRL